MTIRFHSKSEDCGWLSNFAEGAFELDGLRWPTVEHYYQARKYVDPEVVERIRTAETAQAARKSGRNRLLVVRDDWDEIKEDVMRVALFAKFEQNRRLRERLLATDDEELVHHSRSDTYWGRNEEGEGENRLGELLMEVRKRLGDVD